jgi:hypothetical protein
MTIVSAEMLEVFVGEPPLAYTLSLYRKDGQGFAMFTIPDPTQDGTIWIPAPIPPIFSENEELLSDFAADLANRGYLLEKPLCRLQ